MKASRLFGVGLSASVLATAAGQVPFTAGNLVVTQIYDGTTIVAGGAAAAVLVVELNISTGAVVQTIPLPTAVVGANRRLTTRGSSTSSSHLTRSLDGQYLFTCGFDANQGDLGAGGLGINTVASATLNRVVGRIDSAGVVDTTTALTDAYSGNDPRSVASTNGIDLWTSGSGGTGTSGGPRYCTLGSTTSVQLSSPPTNTRVINIFFGQLYETSASTVFQGVSTVGTGLPTTTGQTTTALAGFPVATGPSNYDFFFADANTIYVADDRTLVAGGGIQKWTFDTGTSTWLNPYTLTTGLTNGCRGLTGRVNRNGTTLWATTVDAVPLVVQVLDTGAASAFATLATSPAPTTGTQPLYRGIDFAPVGTVVASCYPNCDQSTTAPCLNVLDFSCFLNEFAAGHTYANCDLSTTPPVLNVLDFSCFLNKFAAGCSAC